MIRIGICDDKKSYRDRLCHIISEYYKKRKNECSVCLFADGEEVLQYRFDLDYLFLDIEMKGTNGIDVKNKMEILQPKCQILFVTNYEDYMKQAFGKNVTAFIDKSHLESVIEYLNRFEKKEYPIIRIGGQYVDTSDIFFIRANGSYCEIFTRQKNILCCIYLHELYHKIQSYGFIRTHRSYVVSAQYIKDITDKRVRLFDQSDIPVARSMKKKVMEEYFDHVRNRW